MSLRSAIVSGTFWTIVGRYSYGITQLLVTAILSRMLSPGEFGIVAMVLSMTAFINVLAEAGIGSALVQKQDLDNDALSAVFWFVLIISSTLAGIVALIAPLIAAFYGVPAVVSITRVISINFIFLGMLTVPLALLRKRLRFKEIAFSEILAAIFGGVIAIAMAYADYGYWALVIQGLLVSAVETTLIFVFVHWKPSITWNTTSIRKVMGYSTYVVGFNSVNYWARNADNILIGKFLGAVQLGFYDHAYRLMLFPLQIITGVVMPVLHPVLATIQHDVNRVRAHYLEIVRLIALVSFPLAAGLWVLSEPLVMVVWGPGWQPTINVFKILALLAAIQPIVSTSGTVFMVRNQVVTYFWVGVFGSVVMIVGFLAGLPWGINGVAIGYTISNIAISIPIMYLVVVHSLSGSMLELTRTLLRPLWVGILTLGVMWIIFYFLPVGSHFLRLLVPASGGIVVFCSYIYFTEPKLVCEVRNFICSGILNIKARSVRKGYGSKLL